MATKSKKKEKTKALNPKHQAFVEAYVSEFGNATRAYKKVYGSHLDYFSAATNGSKLLKNTQIRAAIDEIYRQKWKDKDKENEKSETFEMIRALGNSDISDIIDMGNGRFEVKDLDQIPPDARQSIQAVEKIEKVTKFGPEVRLVVKLHSKIEALKLRAQIQGMIDNRLELSGDIEIMPAAKPKGKEEKEKS